MKAIKQLRKKVKEIEEYINSYINSQETVKSDISNWYRTEQQDMAMSAMYLGIVVATDDPWRYNRVRYFCPTLHTRAYLELDQLPWAWPISPQGGFDDSGCTWVPPAGSVICIIFEAGNRESGYYIGTTWQRDRTHFLSDMGKYLEEYNTLWRGHRIGYMQGPDETQVYPPWNTDNYQGLDIEQNEFLDVNPQSPRSRPHIYGWKSPEKHMIQMDDGDPMCFHRYKRMMFQSSMGHTLLFKDDPLHPCGEWLNPSCMGGGEQAPDAPATFTVPLEATAFFTTFNNDFVGVVSGIFTSALISSSVQPPDPNTCGPDPQCGDNSAANQGTLCSLQGQCKAKNIYHKNRSECGLCVSQKCFLDQSGVMLMSRAGHGILMDDSVEQPRPLEPRFEQGLGFTPFDYDGCTGKYKGRFGLLSSTGHSFELNDSEDVQNRRGQNNGIRMHTASGIDVFLCDQDDGDTCVAGENRGFHILTTSMHKLDMVDYKANTCSPTRMCGGVPNPDATQAYCQLRTGYGLYIRFDDATDQKTTTKQYIELMAPQKTNTTRGPHIFRMQEAPGASPKPMIYLRAGGEYFIQTYDDMFEMVGVPASGGSPGNPSDKIEIITKDKVVYCFEDYLNKARSHVFIADENIYLLAGKDCPSSPGETGCNPCVGPVVFYLGGCLRLSDRVFASGSPESTPANIFMLEPLTTCPPVPGCGGGSGSGS